MSSRRIAKVAEAIRETVSTTILFELKDPRVQQVTVIRAEVSPDLRFAKVYVSILGDEKREALSLHGLNAARGFIQKKLADRLQTRYTPVLQFVVDHGVKVSVETSRLLREALLHTAPEMETMADAEAAAARAQAPPDTTSDSAADASAAEDLIEESEASDDTLAAEASADEGASAAAHPAAADLDADADTLEDDDLHPALGERSGRVEGEGRAPD